MVNPFEIMKNFVADKLSTDISKMLIRTGATAWILSSAAQIGAIAINPKIKDEQKGFLIPQEIFDALINIASFIVITCSAKKLTAKLFSTGKFAPKSLRNYFNLHKDVFENRIGKVDFNIDKIAKDIKDFPLQEYYAHKNFWTTISTVCAAVLASNIVTPLIRNKMASKAQKNYIFIAEEAKVPKPNIQSVQRPALNTYNSGSMKI